MIMQDLKILSSVLQEGYVVISERPFINPRPVLHVI